MFTVWQKLQCGPKVWNWFRIFWAAKKQSIYSFFTNLKIISYNFNAKANPAGDPEESLERRPVAHSVSCDLGPWSLHQDEQDLCLSEIPTWSERFGSRRAAHFALDVSELPSRFVEGGSGFIFWSVESPFWCAWWTRPPRLRAEMLALAEIWGGAVRKRSNSMEFEKKRKNNQTFYFLEFWMHSWCNSDFDAFQHSVRTLCAGSELCTSSLAADSSAYRVASAWNCCQATLQVRGSQATKQRPVDFWRRVRAAAHAPCLYIYDTFYIW